MNFAGRAFGHRIERRKPGQAAREFIEPPHRPHAAGRNFGLLAHAAGQRRGDDGHHQKNHQRQQFVRFGNGEGVNRLDEEKIVGQERKHRGIDRRPDAEAHGGQQNRQQKHHREVGNWRELGQQFADAKRRGHRGCRIQERQRLQRETGPPARQPDARRRLHLARDQMDRDVLRPPHQLVRQRAAQQLAEKAAAGAADHDLGDVLEFRKAQQFGRQIAAGQKSASRRRDWPPVSWPRPGVDARHRRGSRPAVPP